MKTLLFCSAACLGAFLVAAAPTALTADPAKEPTAPLVLERGLHHEVLGLLATNVTAEGRTEVVTNALTRLATGLNYRDAQGQLVPASDALELVDGGAIGWAGQHKVSLAWNLNVANAVQLRLPDGQLLTSQVHGLAYYEVTTGKAVLIAQVQDSQGQLVARNQLLFTNALDHIAADVRYTYTISGFEQDIILREAPPNPEQFGLNPAVTRLEVWTEFPDAPTPARSVAKVAERSESKAEAAVELDDEQIDFGSLRLGTGKAFRAEQADDSLGIVAKQWVTDGGRNFLVETVALGQVEAVLESLPARQGGAAVGQPARERLLALRALPTRERGSVRGKVRQPTSRELVALNERPGLVLDWFGLNSNQTNFVFKGDETYWVTGPVNLYGTNTTFEGGTVLKFTNNVSGLKVTVNTPLTWEGSLYRPVVLTAQSDHATGQKIGSATLGGYYADVALSLDATTNLVTNFQLAHLRVAHAKTAIELKQKSGHVLSHLQLVNCETGIAPTGADFSLRNALFYNVTTNFNGSSSTGRVEHLTVDGATWFHHGTTFAQLLVTNSLLAGVANLGTVTVTNQVALEAGGAVFAPVKGGFHYLAANSLHRNAGTAAIHPGLASDLAGLTTYPPVELTANFSVNTSLQPQAGRDTDLPDLGYHYPPLDYIWSNLSVASGKTLTLLNGVAVGLHGANGLTVNGALNSTGQPQALNRLTLLSTVQEQLAGIITNTGTFTLRASGGTAMALRFTDISFLAAPTAGREFTPYTVTSGDVTAQDCQFRGVYWNSIGYSTLRALTLKNCLLDRTTLSWGQGYSIYPNWLAVNLQNCLVSRSTVGLTHAGDYYGSWTLYDNLFDSASLSLTEMSPYPNGSALTTAGNNGFIATANAFGGANNRTNLLRDFVPGPLGAFYYPASGATNSLASLRNADAVRTAAGVGLAHYTTTQDQAKDTGYLDIGYHYVATESYLASAGFSGTQGANGWFYQYGELKGAPLGYLTNYNSGSAYWYNWSSGVNQYCWLLSASQHPGTDYDSIRAFQVPRTGRFIVTGAAADGHNACGLTEGSFVAVLLGAYPLTPWINVADGATNVVVAGGGRAQAGDLVRFQLNKGTGNGCDMTLWDPRLTLETALDTDGDGLPDWFEDSNGDGVQNSSDGTADTDSDGVSDRLDARPWDPAVSTFSLFIDVPANGGTVN